MYSSYLAIGDSITYGSYAPFNYKEQLAGWNNGYSFATKAQPGYTTTQILNGFRAFMAADPGAQMVLLMVAGLANR